MVAIIGAGITGLALAEYLHWADIPFRLYEASDRVGGSIRTETFEGFQLESGPNSLRLDDDLYGFIERVGMADKLIPAAKAAKKRFVLRDGKYRAMPTGALSLIFGSFFSWKTKGKFWDELRLPGKWVERESFDAFARRRFGDEFADYAIGPFVSGIYAGNSKELLLEEAFPRFKKFEMENGSVIRGMMKAAKANQHKGIVSFNGGLQDLIDGMAARLEGNIQLNSPVQGLDTKDRLEIQIGNESVRASALVFTVPAHVLGKVFQAELPEVANGFAKVTYPPVAVVHTAFEQGQVSHPLDGFGALHNTIEDSNGLGTIFSSSVFPHRAPAGKVLLTTFAGGTLQPEKARLSDTELGKDVLADMDRFLGINGKPIFQKIIRLSHGIPQYDSNILSSRAYLRKMELKKIYFGGNWIGGISVSNCVQRAREIAEKIIGRRPTN